MPGRKRKELYYTMWYEDRLPDDKARKAELQKKYDAKRKDTRAVTDKLRYLRRKAEKLAKERAEAGEELEVTEPNLDPVDDCSNESPASHFDHLSATEEIHGSNESDDASYEPCRKKSKREVRAEAATHSLALDINNSPSSFHASFDRNNDDVSMEVVPLSNNYSEHGYSTLGGDFRRTFFNQMNQFAAPFVVVKNLNVSIPSVNNTKTRISRSKVSGSKITQEQRSTNKTYPYSAIFSKKASSGQVTPDSNRAVKSSDKASSNQEDRYKYITIRKPRKLPQRRESVPINEEPREENVDSDANLNRRDVVQSGDISDEEGNQEAAKGANHRTLQENHTENVTIRRPRKIVRRQKSTSINEESQEEDSDSDANLNGDDVVQSGDISHEEGNQEVDGSEGACVDNPVNYLNSNRQKFEKQMSLGQRNIVTANVTADVRKKVKQSKISQKALTKGLCKCKQNVGRN